MVLGCFGIAVILVVAHCSVSTTFNILVGRGEICDCFMLAQYEIIFLALMLWYSILF